MEMETTDRINLGLDGAGVEIVEDNTVYVEAEGVAVEAEATVAQATAVEEPTVKVGHTVEPTAADEKKAKNFIKDLLDYIQGSKFITRCNTAGSKLGVPPKQVASSFLTRILATVGDVLHTGIFYTQDILMTTIGVLASLLKGATSILCTAVDGLVRLITLNKTLAV